MKVGPVLTICLLAMLPFIMAQEECLKVHNVTRSQVEALAPNTSVADVPLNIKCYSRCVIHDYIGSEGKIDLKLIENRSSSQEQRILGECKRRFDDVNGCDYAYLMLQCLFLEKAKVTNVN